MLAIIIPYYKLTFFESTLQSLVNQTDKRFKVYIGDDASPEDCTILLEKYKEQFDFVYHRFENNLGSTSLAKQWERCIALSGDEEWLMILGDDDVLGENVVEAFYNCLPEIVAENINVVRYASQLIDREGQVMSKVYTHPTIQQATDFILRKILRQTRSSLSEYVIKRQQAAEIGFRDFPLAWYSDDVAILEFSKFKDIYCINEGQLYIRYTTDSISGDTTNTDLKKEAHFLFYYFLISAKSNYFNQSQLKLLHEKLEKCYINDKRQIRYFIKIIWCYLSNSELIKCYRFIKSILYYTLRIK